MTELTDLLELSGHVWQRCRERLAGLDDEEFGWEPVPPDSRITLAWRLDHIAHLLDEERNAVWLGRPPAKQPGVMPRTAAEARARLDDAYATWRDVLSSVDELDAPLKVGPYGTATRRSFVYHILDELIHHAAEAALLRDLYRERFTRSGH